MKIRCSHCGTVYEMEEALLKEADLHVACSQCHRLFKASSLDDFLADKEPGDGSRPDREMDELLAEMEETLAGLEQIELEKPRIPSSLPAALDTGIPPEMEELKSRDLHEAYLFPPAETERAGSSPLTWLFAFLLLALLAGQLAWLYRDQLLREPRIRALAEEYCPRIGCTLPPLPARSAFLLLDRSFESTGPHAYRLRLLLQNDAATTEPPPAIRLTLRDSQQRMVARRTLEAPVYLRGRKIERLDPGGTLEVNLDLAVPGGPVTGYEIELIPARS